MVMGRRTGLKTGKTSQLPRDRLSAAENFLYETLLKLPPTGNEGFEGFIAGLLEAWTGFLFRLCSSGYQAGQDAATDPASFATVAVECKRFGRGTELNERELLGEIVQCHQDFRDPDLWVLVSSRPVLAQTAKRLHREAEEKGFSCAVLDLGGPAPSRLAVLCAHQPEATLRLLRAWITGSRIEGLLHAINEIRALPRFNAVVNEISRLLDPNQLGFEGAKKISHQSFLTALSSRAASHTALGQDWAFRSPGVQAVPRKKIFSFLDAWLEDETPLAVLHAQEGHGKSWAAAMWLARRIENGKAPWIPLVVTSRNLAVQETGPNDFIAHAAVRILHKGHLPITARKVGHWLKRPLAQGPAFLLLLDGMNERPSFKWLQLLSSFFTGNWADRVRLLATTRPTHWNNLREQLISLQGSGPSSTKTYFKEIHVPEYDDHELDIALRGLELPWKQPPDKLKPLLRKPRYCDLAVRHFAEVCKAEDFTIERLLYEDFKDRGIRKGENAPLDDWQFRYLLRNLAERMRDRIKALSRPEVESLVPGDPEVVLSELIDSGILVQQSGSLPKVSVDPLRLQFGMALVLNENLQEAIIRGANARDEISKFLEPHPDMDFKAGVLSAAVYFASKEPEYPEAATIALLVEWVSCRNWDERWEEDVGVYLAEFPHLYIQAAETVYASESANQSAMDRLRYAFCNRRDRPEVLPHLVKACERWMGIFETHSKQSEEEDDGSLLRQKARDRLGLTSNGTATFLSFPITATDNASFRRLQDLGWKIIGAGKRRPFLDAILSWEVASTLTKLMVSTNTPQWVLRLTSEHLSDPLIRRLHERAGEDDALIQDVERQIRIDAGGVETWETPSEIPPPGWMGDLHIIDETPCGREFWFSRIECMHCMDRENVSPGKILQQIKDEVLDPELKPSPRLLKRLPQATEELRDFKFHESRSMTKADLEFDRLEPGLAAFAPSVLANFIRDLVCSFEDNHDNHPEVIRSFAWFLEKHHLLLREPELAAVEILWRKVLAKLKKTGARDEVKATTTLKFVEKELLWVLLPAWSGVKRLEALSERPELAWFGAEPFPEILAFEDRVEAHRFAIELLYRTEPNVLWAALRFLDPRFEIDDATEKRVIELLHHDHHAVRQECLEIALRFENPQLREAVIATFVPGKGEECRREQELFALLLEKAGHRHSPEQIWDNAGPTLCAEVIERRGFPREEVAAFGTLLDQRYGESWDDSWIPESISGSLVKTRSELLEKWTEERNKSNEQVHFLNPRYADLLWKLVPYALDGDETRGGKLWEALISMPCPVVCTSGDEEIHRLRTVPFQAKDSQTTLELRNLLVEECQSDRDHMDIALAAHKYGRAQWLEEKIDECLRSDVPWLRARGLTLLGFSQLPEATFRRLVAQARTEGTWLAEVEKNTTAHWERYRNARHWFEQFLHEEDMDRAWAGFRLFLRCVDHRYWTWARELLDADSTGQWVSAHPRRSAYLWQNSEEIGRAAKNFASARENELFTLSAGEQTKEIKWLR